ncbi:MAG: hypothetical protein AAGA66_03715 [Bacteroidota bacterium]
MKKIKKGLKLVGFILIVSLASIGLGFNAAIMPSFKRQEDNGPTIELAESREEEADHEEDEKP